MDWTQIDLGRVLISITVLLFSLSIHEMAHAWSAEKLGDPTARDLGRVTLNPLVHMDPIGTILFPLMGLLLGGVVFGWARPVPVDTRNLRRPKQDHLLIAAAGPASNVVAAVGFLLALKLVQGFFPGGAAESTTASFLLTLCVLGLLLNVILAVFNLLPVPPLDGSWILSGLMPDQFGRLMDAIRPYSFLLLIVMLYAGVFRTILGPVLEFVYAIAL